MRTVSLGDVAHEPEAAVQVKHKTPVPHGFRKPFIAGMRSCKQGEIRCQ